MPVGENRDPEGLSKVERWRCHHANSLCRHRRTSDRHPSDPMYLSWHGARAYGQQRMLGRGRFWGRSRSGSGVAMTEPVRLCRTAVGQ